MKNNQDKIFTEKYSILNKEQKQAVDTIDGPVMIIAGPGTGKTTTLTMRIANILKNTDTSPDSILALTFTQSGVKAMREYLRSIIGTTAYYVNIHTFHSFCTELININPDIFEKEESIKVLSDLERIQLIKNVLNSLDLEILKPFNAPDLYLKDISSSITSLKQENISPKDFENLIYESQKNLDNEIEINPRTKKPYTKFTKKQKEIDKQKELLTVYKEFLKQIKEIKRIDFEDMINIVVDKMKRDENFRLSLQEKYLYVLVDEYQDTNSSQNEIIKYLTLDVEEPNVFVVGDDDQAIYRFQGASLENILNFKELFPNAIVIALQSNYRSSNTIIEA